ncbi:MAG: ion channel [Cyanobacteria bacterium P01_F01_bin.150]
MIRRGFYGRSHSLRSFSLRSISIWIQTIWEFAEREDIPKLVGVVVAIIFTSSILLYWVEPDVSFVDSLWWSLVTLTTVGYGDITPVTFAGRCIAAVDMLVGIGILAILTAKIASTLIERKNRENLGMTSYYHQDHMILCEWNYRSQTILKELRHELRTQTLPVVLIANIDHKPVDDNYLFFVKGDVTDTTLMQANLPEADTVIILGDDTLEDRNRDAKVILSTLTVESINPDAYTVVELVSKAHASTCKRANADEVIVRDEMSSRMLLNTALNHGMSSVVMELLCHQYGNQLGKSKASEHHIDQRFIDVLLDVKKTSQSILIGIQQGENGEVLSNPDAGYKIQPEDLLILIRPGQQQ